MFSLSYGSLMPLTYCSIPGSGGRGAVGRGDTLARLRTGSNVDGIGSTRHPASVFVSATTAPASASASESKSEYTRC